MRITLVLPLCALLGACGDDSGGDGPKRDAGPSDAAPLIINGTLVPASADGEKPAGPREDGTALIPGGRELTPVGPQIRVGGFPLGMRLLTGGKHLLITDGAVYDEHLTLVDLGEKKIVQRLLFDDRKQEALFLGLAVRADGHIFASGGGNDVIREYSYDAGAVAPLLEEQAHPMPPSSYVAGLAFIDDRRLLVAFQTQSAVMLYDTVARQEIARLVFGGEQPYDIVVDDQRQEAYVSLWATRQIAVLSTAGGGLSLVARVTTGKSPESLLLYPAAQPQKLLVANSASDTVSVVDLDRREVTADISVTPPARPQKGTVPTHLALSPDGARLYVASSGDNAVDVLATGSWTPLGRIPTGWYPTAVLALPDGSLAVAAAKGLGATKYVGGTDDNTEMHGLLGLVPPQSAEDLAAGATQVEANNTRPERTGPHVACPASGTCVFPLPPKPGLPTPIQHVVLIQRENQTYDACLGDLAGANGDPSLVVFPEKYTPNLHALARAFVNGDNFYSNAEASIQGHHWTTGGAISDYVEKTWLTTWGRGSRDVTLQSRPATAPEQGYYWQHLSRNGVSYRSFGQIVGATGGQPGDTPIVIDAGWPGGFFFNLAVKDVERAKYFQAWIDDKNPLPSFTYLLMPNNHTSGTSPGKWTMEYMVADNDEGTGRLVETLSHAATWPSTIIFIIEDDPANGFDHVEAHRSTLVVVSPWVKRGFMAHTHYDYASLWRTIEHLLGVPPLSQNTATAALMFDIFTTTPDYTPYTHIDHTIPEKVNPPRAKPASKIEQDMDFSQVDDAPGLSRVIWRHMKGTEPPWQLPWDPVEGADEDDD